MSIFTDEKSFNFLVVVGMSKNLKFLEQVEAMFSKDDEIVVVGLIIFIEVLALFLRVSSCQGTFFCKYCSRRSFIVSFFSITMMPMNMAAETSDGPGYLCHY